MFKSADLPCLLPFLQALRPVEPRPETVRLHYEEVPGMDVQSSRFALAQETLARARANVLSTVRNKRPRTEGEYYGDAADQVAGERYKSLRRRILYAD